MMETKDHPHQRAYHPARKLRSGSGTITGRTRKEMGKRKEETYMQDLKEVRGQLLEGCTCSYGSSSMSLTWKTYHTHAPYHTDIDISADSRW